MNRQPQDNRAMTSADPAPDAPRYDPSASVHKPLAAAANRKTRRVTPAASSRGPHPVHAIAVEYCEIQRAKFRESVPGSLVEAKAARRSFPAPLQTSVQTQDYSEDGYQEATDGEFDEGLFDTLRAPFADDEISLGPKLGTGEFSDVYEIKSFKLSDAAANWNEAETERRTTMKKMEKYHSTNNARYALKRIRGDFLRERGAEEYVQAAGDLALEAEFLGTLSHPNIVRLRGLTHSGVVGFGAGPAGYFLIIDRLFETLDRRIERWHGKGGGAGEKKGGKIKRGLTKGIKSISRRLTDSRRPTDPTGSMGSMRRLSGKSTKKGDRGEEDGEGRAEMSKEEKLVDECLFVGLQIAAALTYLHQHSIIFRDLKPANIGFDVRGDVKIFDFGLARIMPESGDPYEDKFEMSGAGSPRYMAPELLSEDSYNLKADVYTFALVLWECLTGQAPYAFVRRRDQLIYHVVHEGGRPEIDESWPSPVQNMLESSFDGNMNLRPSMNISFEKIRKTLVAMRGSDVGLSDSFINCRRTALSFGRNNKQMVSSFKDAANEVPV